MAHALPTAPAILCNTSLDREAVWQARVDLAACFRVASRLRLHEDICNHLAARQMRDAGDEPARLHPENIKRTLDREAPDYRH